MNRKQIEHEPTPKDEATVAAIWVLTADSVRSATGVEGRPRIDGGRES